MKRINNLILFAISFSIFGISSCQKESMEEIDHFNIEDYTGRYIFDIKMDTHRDGILTTDYYNSVGYVTKKNDYIIKVIFDYAAPKINCSYEYAVKADGTFFSLDQAVGKREGKFFENKIEFSEKIDLGNGNSKSFDFFGSNEKL